MSYHMIIRRGSTRHFRRAVPKALRSIIGHREITRSLHTSDLREAKSRAITVATEVDALLWRARRTLANPEAAVSAVAAQLVRQDAEARRGVLADDDQAEREQAGLLDELERLTERPLPSNLGDAVQARARIQALRTILAKLEGTNGTPEHEDVTLSGLFERYQAERKPSAKVWREFDLTLRRFIEVNGDLSVRSIGKQHVRALKSALLTMPNPKPRRGQQEGATLSTSTVVKLLGLLRSVFAWGEWSAPHFDCSPRGRKMRREVPWGSIGGRQTAGGCSRRSSSGRRSSGSWRARRRWPSSVASSTSRPA
jgi:hypothetical protein